MQHTVMEQEKSMKYEKLKIEYLRQLRDVKSLQMDWLK